MLRRIRWHQEEGGVCVCVCYVCCVFIYSHTHIDIHIQRNIAFQCSVCELSPSHTQEGSSRVHHVEVWGPFPQRWLDETGASSSSSSSWDGGHSWETACEYGEKVNEEYVALKVRRQEPPLDRAHCMAGYRIHTSTGPLPFDFKLETNVDLVVGDTACQNALHLLHGFDLSICQPSWDGQTFRVPFPHLTFTRKSGYESGRAEAMGLTKINLLFFTHTRIHIQAHTHSHTRILCIPHAHTHTLTHAHTYL